MNRGNSSTRRGCAANAAKMKRMEVCRDYKLLIDFNIEPEQFAANLAICEV